MLVGAGDVAGQGLEGARLREGLLALQDRYPFIGDVRGKGLMQALELVEDRRTKEPAPRRTLRLAEATRRLGLLVGKGGLHGNVVRLGPPMLIETTSTPFVLAKSKA